MVRTTKQKRRPIALTRTRVDDARWVLRSVWFRAAAGTVVLALVVAIGAWQWPTFSENLLPEASAPTNTSSPYTALSFKVGLSDSSASKVAGLRADLSKAIGVAETTIASKIDDGVAKKKTEPARNAAADATALLDEDVRFTVPLGTALDRVQKETGKLEDIEPPRDDPAPPNGGGGNGGGGGSQPPSNDRGNDGGGSSPPPRGGGGRATSSASITCSGSNITVVFTARGGGTVNVSVSGPASGSNSGSGSATVSVSGPGGTYTASASASGSVSVSGQCR